MSQTLDKKKNWKWVILPFILAFILIYFVPQKLVFRDSIIFPGGIRIEPNTMVEVVFQDHDILVGKYRGTSRTEYIFEIDEHSLVAVKQSAKIQIRKRY